MSLTISASAACLAIFEWAAAPWPSFGRPTASLGFGHALFAAFFMGLAAAAPMGPVNMMAVRRGVAGGWRHTLVCGIGSVVGDLFLFMLALLGGHYLLPSLSNPALKVVMAAAGTILLIPVGGYFILLALRDPRKTFAKARKRLGREDLPAHMIGEAARAAALTVFNPLTVLYWAAITSNWLALASLSLGAEAYAWGILMAGAGLASWFALLTLIVRFIPKRFGAVFFRLVNAVLGFVLIGFGAYCALLVYRDHLL